MLPRGGVTPRQRRPPALMCRLLPRCLSSLCNPSGACLDIGELVYTFRLLSSLMYVGRGIGAPSPRHCPELVPPMYPPFAPLGNSGVPPAPVGESLRRNSRTPPVFYYVPFLVPVRSSSGPRSQKFAARGCRGHVAARVNPWARPPVFLGPGLYLPSPSPHPDPPQR